MQGTVFQNGDLCCKRHGLDLVMCHIDDCGAHAIVKAFDLGAHVDAQLGIEIGERLVKQEDLRLAYKRPSHRHALALPSGQLARLAVEKVGNLQHLRNPGYRLFALRLRDTPDFHAETDVLCDSHVGIERIGLEDHRDVALGRVLARNIASIDPDFTACDGLQSGNRVEQRRLPAPGRTYQDEKATLVDFQIDTLEDLDLAKGLVQVPYFQECHYSPLYGTSHETAHEIAA